MLPADLTVGDLLCVSYDASAVLAVEGGRSSWQPGLSDKRGIVRTA